MRVSIHAPVKVRTFDDSDDKDEFAGFNPRTREGANKGGRAIQMDVLSFNPRTREGANV